MLKIVSTSRFMRSVAAVSALLTGLCLAQGQVVTVPTEPRVGSSNPVSAEPGVPRPHTKPCVVNLFENVAFDNFTPYAFSYAPPSGCPGPWSKVVFTADFTVTEGRQFDRTASFYLGRANIYYGTTAEPRKILSPSWHVERDVTDLTTVFKSNQNGQADLGNFVGTSGGVTYNGIIYATAALEFYPVSWSAPPVTPDIVVPVEGPGGDAGTLNSTTDQITQTLDLPRNVERVYLDVIAQSESGDEFWYFCVPNDQATNLQSCGNTAFRETEIYIDDQPAGVAPVFPWIYTGGIDPYLWEPITGIQTLDFKPYRVDLTPFAGVLSDGRVHTLAISVFNADSYFLATANLLVFTDHCRPEVSGGLITNTLTSAPAPLVVENITGRPGPVFTGTVSVSSRRKFTISGYVETSHGRVETTLEQVVDFASNQQFNVSANQDVQNLMQTSQVHSHTTVRDGFLVRSSEHDLSYPLTLDYAFVINGDGSAVQTTGVKQENLVRESNRIEGFETFRSSVEEKVESKDTLNFGSNGSITGPPPGATAAASYSAKDSLGHCYSRNLAAAAQKLTAVEDGRACTDRDHDRN